MSSQRMNVYETCDPHYLQELRSQVGMDVVQLARIACLSVSQVKSLELGSDDLFYSPAIKRQAYKRVMMILGAPPPVAFAEPERDDTLSPPISPTVNESLNQIADLTTQPVHDVSSSANVGHRMGRQTFMMAALVVVAALAVFIALDARQGDTQVVVASAVSSEAKDQTVRMLDAAPAVVSPAVVDSVAEKAASDVVQVAARGASGCAFSSDPGPEVSAGTPKKEGRFVYVLSPTDTSVCVVDGNKQASPLQLKAGEGRSVYGSSPWQISGNNLTEVQIYFQGWRASLPEGTVQKIVLVEKPLTP